MNPILFDKSETNFTTNGLGRLECISCEVIEERNGIYELEAEIPISGNHAADIEIQSIIGAIPHDGGNIQAFYVYNIDKPINGRFKVYARHISYRLTDIPCKPFSVEMSPTAAADTLAGLKNNALEPCPFYFHTDLTTPAPYKQETPASIRQRLGGVEGSVLDQFGGEFEWDNFDVHLWKQRGRLANVTGISLRYGKNITDINQEEEISSTVTGVVPFWIDTDGNNLVMLPEYVVYSEYADNYPYHLTQVLDLSGEYDNKPTIEQLRGAATTYVNKTGLGIPKVSIKVSFVNLWETEEYKDIAPLERVQLCDEINVNFEKLGILAIAKVVKTRYDVLKERYIQIEVGSIRTTLAQAVTDRDKDIDSAFVSTITKMSQAVQSATAWLTNANGYVVARKNEDGSWRELLFMNTNDPATATSGIRINNNGIGFFSKVLYPAGNVLDGPYSTAWTIDGRLGDAANKNFWNFITGQFSLSEGTTVGGQTVQEIADAAQSAAENTAAQALAAQVAIYDADIADLQNQIDGNVTTWYYSGVPTLNNLPASQWTTTTDKDNHIGDLYYDSATGYAYRFMKDGNNYVWTKISDSDIEAALSEAQDAWDLADNKRRVFITQPVPPYDIGDMWVQGSNGDILRCATAKTVEQTFSVSDWVLASKYTDDSALTSFISGIYATDKTNLQNQIDGKAETWYQSSDPSTAWTTPELKAQHEGDLWYKTTDNTTWYYNGSNWVQQNVPTAVFDKIDGKAQIFTSQPTTPYFVGDLWFNSTATEIKVCINARSTGSYTASDWEKRDKYVDSTDISNAITAYDGTLDQDEVFNRLIGSDTAQGIVLSNGKLYLRGEYLTAGAITIGGTAYASNPTLIVKNSGGIEIGSWTKDGIRITGGSISGPTITGGTINGSAINVPNASSPQFSVNSNGSMTAKAGAIGGLTLANGELYANGDRFIIENKSVTLSKNRTNSYKTVCRFDLSSLGLSDGTYEIYDEYYLERNASSFAIYLDRRNKGGSSWSNVGSFVLYTSSGWHTERVFNVYLETIYDYRLRVKYSTGSSLVSTKHNIYFANAKTISLKNTGATGNFVGSFTGVGNFDSVSVGNTTISDDGINSTDSATLGEDINYFSLDFDGIYCIDDNGRSVVLSNFNSYLGIKKDSSNWVQVEITSIWARSSGTYMYYDSHTSDERQKHDIAPLDSELSIKFIDATETKSFEYNGLEGKHYGMIAQEARALLDSLGETDAKLEHSMGIKDAEIDDPRTIDYAEYIPHLINYVKDLRAIVNSQQAEIEELKAIVKKLSV